MNEAPIRCLLPACNVRRPEHGIAKSDRWDLIVNRLGLVLACKHEKWRDDDKHHNLVTQILRFLMKILRF